MVKVSFCQTCEELFERYGSNEERSKLSSALERQELKTIGLVILQNFF